LKKETATARKLDFVKYDFLGVGSYFAGT
jgi:hypothetical protein